MTKITKLEAAPPKITCPRCGSTDLFVFQGYESLGGVGVVLGCADCKKATSLELGHPFTRMNARWMDYRNEGNDRLN